MLDRRKLLISGGLGLSALTFAPGLSFAKVETDRRFVFIILRGAADGLSIVAPVGDPAYAAARRLNNPDIGNGTPLDTVFMLHPAMQRAAQLYANGQAMFVHGVASRYRDRSHFDGQNLLEGGGPAPFAERSGWLNRLLSLLPGREADAIAFTSLIPLAMRGDTAVRSYDTGYPLHASPGLLKTLSTLYDSDTTLHPLWSQAMTTDALAGGLAAANKATAAGALAGRLLAAEDGPRIAMLDSMGWDTHAQQQYRMTAQLRTLDATLIALQTELGPAWDRTVVLAATEFGRTVAFNSGGGTDHGTASVAMLFGGAIKGKRVIADWPGLSPAALFEGRDLKPTLDLESIIAGVASEHFGLDYRRVAARLFPGCTARPSEGLVRVRVS